MGFAPSERRAVLLMGPTAAGKSALALELVAKLPLEIVSVDSALVYRGMDIGTAKPDAATLKAVPHHLVDIRDPVQTYSAGEFVLDAKRAMEEIWRRGRHPLLVGGTMLYFHAVSTGIADLPEADLAIRAEIDARAATEGWPYMHRELGRVDPLAAARIHCNDSQRIQRALEVHRITGSPISTLQKNRQSVLAGINVVELAIAPRERLALHRRIDARLKSMLDLGFVEEVRRLRERKELSAEHPSMRAVGYRQLWRYLAGQLTLTAAVDDSIVATRQLAKRQFTWLRARQHVEWVDSLQFDAISSMTNALARRGITQWSG